VGASDSAMPPHASTLDHVLSPVPFDLDWAMLRGLSTEDGPTASPEDVAATGDSLGIVTQVEEEGSGSPAAPFEPTRPKRKRRPTMCGTGGHRVHRQ
jgi:hypothetical protein